MHRFLLVLMLISFSVGALQKVQIQEGAAVTLSVAQDKLNQIKIAGGRIDSVKGQGGEFKIIQDNKVGTIFIQPLVKHKIQIFLLSEAGVSYSLYLIPHEIDAETIVLVPEEEFSQQVYQFAAVPYTQIIAKLITAMYNQELIDGFKREAVQQKIASVKGLPAIKTLAYKNGAIVGEIIEIKNNTVQQQELKEIDFYQSGVRAVSIAIENLPDKAFTRVFIVRDEV